MATSTHIGTTAAAKAHGAIDPIDRDALPAKAPTVGEPEHAPSPDDGTASDPQSEAHESTAEELEAQHEQDIQDALETVFNDIRNQSGNSELVTPDRWASEEFIPSHLTSQEFVDTVFGLLEERAETPSEDNDNGVDLEAVDSIEPPEQADGQSEASEDNPEEDSAQNEPEPLRCDDIAFMEGADTMYLYSRDFMTDNYANWAFLALEDNTVTTLVQCTREESRVYPRPMIYSSLENPPFNLTEDQILDAWKAVQESGLYPDICSCDASNDDVYFYSTDFLSKAQAEALAEWYSVERPMHM